MGEAEAAGVPSGAGLGTPIVAGRGEDDQGMAQVHKGELRRRDAHGADETTPRGVGLEAVRKIRSNKSIA